MCVIVCLRDKERDYECVCESVFLPSEKESERRTDQFQNSSSSSFKSNVEIIWKMGDEHDPKFFPNQIETRSPFSRCFFIKNPGPQ